MSWLHTTVDVAGVVSGAAAAAALLYTARQDKKSKKDAERAVANKFVAWAVTQGPEGQEFLENGTEGGVVVLNATDEVALTVDVKTERSVDLSHPQGFTSDGFSGQRFALIPPGTYYLPQVTEEGVNRWAQPIAVDHSSGQLTVKLLNDQDDLVTHTLVPVTQRPEPRRVTLLRFQLADRMWHRSTDGSLQRGPGSRAFDKEFEGSQVTGLSPVAGRQHQPNEASQDLVTRLFLHLTAGAVDPQPNAAAEASAQAKAWGIEAVRRSRGRGQGLFLMTSTSAAHPRFYISGGKSGSNVEAFPNDGLQFNADGGKDERLNVPEFKRANTASHWSTHFDELIEILGREIRTRLQQGQRP